ncbi:hypothetical protein RFI_27323, partial [Reticulomyxa filosa]
NNNNNNNNNTNNTNNNDQYVGHSGGYVARHQDLQGVMTEKEIVDTLQLHQLLDNRSYCVLPCCAFDAVAIKKGYRWLKDTFKRMYGQTKGGSSHAVVSRNSDQLLKSSTLSSSPVARSKAQRSSLFRYSPVEKWRKNKRLSSGSVDNGTVSDEQPDEIDHSDDEDIPLDQMTRPIGALSAGNGIVAS